VIYGHVVACDVFGVAYVVPTDDTIYDIADRLEAYSVCLPLGHEICETGIANSRSILGNSPQNTQNLNAQEKRYSPGCVYPQIPPFISSMPSQALSPVVHSVGDHTSPPLCEPESIQPDSGYSTIHTTPNTSPPPLATITNPQSPHRYEKQNHLICQRFLTWWNPGIKLEQHQSKEVAMTVRLGDDT